MLALNFPEVNNCNVFDDMDEEYEKKEGEMCSVSQEVVAMQMTMRCSNSRQVNETVETHFV